MTDVTTLIIGLSVGFFVGLFAGAALVLFVVMQSRIDFSNGEDDVSTDEESSPE